MINMKRSKFILNDSILYFTAMFLFSFFIIASETIYFHMLLIVTNYISATFIISIALLGLAAGSIFAFYLLDFRKEIVILLSSVLFIISIVLSYFNIMNIGQLKYPVFLILPFMLSSIIISTIFSYAHSNKIYFTNLIASAAGVFYPIIFLPLLKSETALMALILLPAVFIIILSFKFKNVIVTFLVLALGIFLTWTTYSAIRDNLKFPSEFSKAQFEEQIIPKVREHAEKISNKNDVDFISNAYYFSKEKDKYVFDGDDVDRQRAKYLLAKLKIIKVYDILFDLKPHYSLYQNQKILQEDLSVIISEDSTMGRVDILESGDTYIMSINGNPLDSMSRTNGTRYDPRVPHLDDAHVFIIGLSADGIVKSAKKLNNSVVEGIEINPVIMKIMQNNNQIAEYSSFPYLGLTQHFGEGRGFLKNSKSDYDMITLMNIHAEHGPICTLAPENFHTVEGTQFLLSKLTDRGMIVYEEIVSTPRSKLAYYKFLNTAVKAMKDLGYQDPSQHILIYHWDFWGAQNFRSIIFKPKPFTKKELSDFYGFYTVIEANPDYAQVGIDYIPDRKTNTVESNIINGEEIPDLITPPAVIESREFITDFVSKLDEKEDFDFAMQCYSKKGSVFIKNQLSEEKKTKLTGLMMKTGYLREVDLSPATDDRPFPFDVYKNRTEITDMMKIIFIFIILLLIPVVLKIIKNIKEHSIKILPQTLYFMVLGFSYMLVEIVLIQKFQYFIGNPTYSLIVILGGLLFFSGLGSFISMKFHRIALIACMIMIPLILLLFLFKLDSIFMALEHYSFNAKLWISLLLIIPLSFFMGMPFPHTLEIVKKQSSNEYGTMMYAMSGAAGTAAVTMSQYTNIVSGFSTTFLIGTTGYIAGIVIFLVLFAKHIK
ncbi:MAG: hypothetical protein JW982_00775 [Spirochaetes bacterium]|nr:hypothetical protein [Spirochaetota bacterium]